MFLAQCAYILQLSSTGQINNLFLEHFLFTPKASKTSRDYERQIISLLRRRTSVARRSSSCPLPSWTMDNRKTIHGWTVHAAPELHYWKAERINLFSKVFKKGLCQPVFGVKVVVDLNQPWFYYYPSNCNCMWTTVCIYSRHGTCLNM